MDVNRLFKQLPNESRNDQYYDINFASNHGNIIWQQLLEKRRVIILAEAGAGKSAELENQAQKLNQQGKKAFFIRLEDINNNFDIAFEVGDRETFAAWLESNEAAWLFFDSVDESRLKNPRDFELAIKTIAKRLGLALKRTHIYITNRASAWRAKTDLALCEKCLPMEHVKSESSIFDIFTLCNLAKEQQITIATQICIKNTKDFLRG